MGGDVTYGMDTVRQIVIGVGITIGVAVGVIIAVGVTIAVGVIIAVGVTIAVGIGVAICIPVTIAVTVTIGVGIALDGGEPPVETRRERSEGDDQQEATHRSEAWEETLLSRESRHGSEPFYQAPWKTTVGVRLFGLPP